MSGPLEKIETGIPGFDFVSHGGLPRNRLTLVAGPAGSGKTVFSLQYLVEGAKRGEKGVFVSFEESVEDLIRNTSSFGWDLGRLREEGLIGFVDASPTDDDDSVVTGDFDLSALTVRIGNAVEKVRAERLAIDSLASLFLQYQDTTLIRRELLGISHGVARMGVTTLLTAEQTSSEGFARFDVEEFVADNVIILRNALEHQRRRSSIELYKFRGSNHVKGAVPFTISNRGVVLLPVERIVLGQASALDRISTGVPGLDEMAGGGLLRDSITLVSGATGTGKTCLATHFVGTVGEDERAVFFGFEEGPPQLRRNAKAWGIDFERLEEEGRLKIRSRYPESVTLEDHLLEFITIVDEVEPRRVAIDSLSALERITSPRHFREFLLHVTAFLKEREIPALITNTAAELMGGERVTTRNISTLTDTIIMLRYFERDAAVGRAIAVLKMRGSQHDQRIREFTVGSDGFDVGEVLTGVDGILES